MTYISPEATPLTEREREMQQKLLGNPLSFPKQFVTWLINFLGTELTLTSSQVVNAETGVFEGSATPEGAVAAPVGSVFLRTDGAAGTSVYFKESGSGTSGWRARDVFGSDLTLEDGNDLLVGSGTGTKLGATGAKLGFMGATPVVRPSSTGEATGFTAGAGTAVDHLATFTGNTGSSAYTLNDVVKHLKTLGLLAS